MELEKQVVSFEVSQEMKKLDFKQESIFYWRSWEDYNHNEELTGGIDLVYVENEIIKDSSYVNFYSAYTVAELGEMLPMSFNPKNDYEYFLEIGHDSYGWSCVYRFYDQDGSSIDYGNIFRADIEADARAKMLIYLIENNLLNNKR
jgi:hypothetical protein